MGTESTKTRKKKKYRMDFSLLSLFLWSMGIFVLMGWIFILGILVGRGFLPEGIQSLTKREKQLPGFHDRVSRKNPISPGFKKKSDTVKKFDFYDKLAETGDKVATKSGLGPEKKIAHQKTSNKVAVPKSGANFTLQLASLERKEKAESLVKRLNDHGYPAYISKVDIGEGTYYRVRCGKFKTKEDALSLEKSLAQREGLKGYVVTLEE